jgi:Threonyl-tRNA synthetase
MNSKIRDAQNQKIPYMLVVGDKEIEQSMVALRLRSGDNPGPVTLESFLERAQLDVASGD